MSLSNEEIATIASWEPIQAGFGREISQTGIRIQGIVGRINSSRAFACKIISDDGLSNYYESFAYPIARLPSVDVPFKAPGLFIYLSSCAPVGVVGRSEISGGPTWQRWSHLEIGALVSPDHPDGRLEECAYEAIRSGGYQLLSGEDVARLLPEGVEPHEYCLGNEPWDRVFHALFANTD